MIGLVEMQEFVPLQFIIRVDNDILQYHFQDDNQE